MARGLILQTKRRYKQNLLKSALSSSLGTENYLNKLNLDDCITILGKEWQNLEKSHLHEAWRSLLSESLFPDLELSPTIVDRESISFLGEFDDEQISNFLPKGKKYRLVKRTREKLLQWLNEVEYSDDHGWEPRSDDDILNFVIGSRVKGNLANEPDNNDDDSDETISNDEMMNHYDEIDDVQLSREKKKKDSAKMDDDDESEKLFAVNNESKDNEEIINSEICFDNGNKLFGVKNEPNGDNDEMMMNNFDDDIDIDDGDKLFAVKNERNDNEEIMISSEIVVDDNDHKLFAVKNEPNEEEIINSAEIRVDNDDIHENGFKLLEATNKVDYENQQNEEITVLEALEHIRKLKSYMNSKDFSPEHHACLEKIKFIIERKISS